jgi:hypothetical protein
MMHVHKVPHQTVPPQLGISAQIILRKTYWFVSFIFGSLVLMAICYCFSGGVLLHSTLFILESLESAIIYQ